MKTNIVEQDRIGERLRLWAYERYGSISGLCRALGKVTSYLNPYLAGRSIPGTVLLHQLEQLGMNTKWLVTGEGEMHNKIYHEQKQSEQKQNEQQQSEQGDSTRRAAASDQSQERDHLTQTEDMENIIFDSREDVLLLKDMLRITVRQIEVLEGKYVAFHSGVLRYLKELQAKHPDPDTQSLLKEIDEYTRHMHRVYGIAEDGKSQNKTLHSDMRRGSDA